MFHNGFHRHIAWIKEKFQMSKENQGDKLVITFAGKKEDVAEFDKKLDAIHTLMDGCCEGKDGKSCC